MTINEMIVVSHEITAADNIYRHTRRERAIPHDERYESHSKTYTNIRDVASDLHLNKHEQTINKIIVW